MQTKEWTETVEIIALNATTLRLVGRYDGWMEGVKLVTVLYAFERRIHIL